MTDVAERARNRLVSLPGHFSTPVRIETVELIGDGILLLRVRAEGGFPDETTISEQELETALEAAQPTSAAVDPRNFFRWIESHRIRLAYAHDPYFAVSLSGIRGLPHQIEAVYRHLLPQPRLRFVLADDPGGGKTIMAGLLHKELKLRGVVDRTLVICPAPLTIQWQDELFEKFDERFEIISSHQVRWQLGGNAWQQYHQAITSLDFAKQEDVLPELLRAEWDLIVVDEAHKCSAASDGEGVRKTKRYVLAEEISKRSERMLLLTATPHSGDEDRFKHFLRLLDPDQFATPDLVKRQIGTENNPYFLRRQKEDLIDEKGRPLFVPRHVVTQPFTLSAPEKALYDVVTAYVNEYLGTTSGSRGSAVALARTVLQRRLASSLGAIRSSLQKRGDRLEERAEELVRMSPAERKKRLIELRVLQATDEETEYEDSDEEAQEEAAVGVTAVEHIEDLRKEVAVLRQLVRKADETIAQGEERKLGALRECLNKSELQELKDGRGKLLIFTEHRDTLDYLVKHLVELGYSVCSIHGGNPPLMRKQIQQEFRTQRQICVATEAAGEGINLQFCHLMINYDLPWNPVRLEQRMGRIHRIGQQSEVHVFNFVATNTVEGRLLERLHEKLAEMKEALQGRVYDVIGDLLQLNGVDFERLVRDTLANPRRLEYSLEEIGSLSPEVLKRYEQDIGIAQATRHVNLDWVRERDWLSEERRLMPEYVQEFFLDAAQEVKLRVEQRADGLYRIEHVPVLLRSDDLASVRRLGRPEGEYRKLTFHKDMREKAEHEDAILLSPGHPLFAATTEALERQLLAAGVNGGVTAFIDPSTTVAYRLHYLTHEVVGEAIAGGTETAYAELVCVLEERDGTLQLAPADVLHDLTPTLAVTPEGPSPEVIKGVTNWIRVNVQTKATEEKRESRSQQAEVRATYLEEAMEVQRKRFETRWADYDQKVYQGHDEYRLPRDETVRRMEELKRRKDTKMQALRRLGVVRGGPVTYLGSVVALPPDQPEHPSVSTLRRDPETEKAAMEFVMAYERAAGRNPEDVSQRRDGSGFDIRSVGDLDPRAGTLDIRRIEVKGVSAPSGDVGLYRTEWYAAQRFRDGFWLYVVYSAKSDQPRLVTIQDPWGRLRNVEEIRQLTGIRVPGASIEELAK
jgi:superfamily II DNA or RNA helicase